MAASYRGKPRGANVLSFGAVGDGVADDTAKINDACASGSKHVLFPPRPYRIAGAVVAPEPSQRIEFAPGAALQFQPTGSFTCSGAFQRIVAPRLETPDSGVEQTYGPLLTLQGSHCRLEDLHYEGGGRSLLPQGVLSVSGGNNVIEQPYITASRARYGIFRQPLAEFLTINGGRIQGRNNGTYEANSEGVFCSHFAGQLKMNAVAVVGFTNAVGIHGSHDAPTFTGCTFVNNRDYCLLLDSGAAVRGMTWTGCYLSDQLGVGFLHCVDGLLEGFKISGCEIGYQEIGILVEDAFGTFEAGVVEACFIQGGIEGKTPIAVVRPGVNSSDLLFVNNKRQTAGTLGTGPYAARAVDIFD